MLCGESDGEGASSDFWVCVWVVEQLLELRVFVCCQLNEYRCSHVEIIPQRHLLDPPHSSPQSVWIVISVGTPHSRSQLTAKLKNANPCSVEISRLNANRRSRERLSRKDHS